MIQHVLIQQLLLVELCMHTLTRLSWSQPRALLAQQSPVDRLKHALELERSKGFKNSMGKVQLFDTFLVSALPCSASHRRHAVDHRPLSQPALPTAPVKQWLAQVLTALPDLLTS